MQLVLFDLDNTLLAGDSDFEWAQFLIEQGVLDREVYEARNQAFYDAYRAGTLDIHAFLDFQLRPLARHSREQLDAWHQTFMLTKIQPIMSAAAKDLVTAHKDALRVVITATNQFVTAPIVKAFGISHLIATEAECVDGRFTGRVKGTPCFQQGKVERLFAWLGDRGQSLEDFSASYFYSDSFNDLPLLQTVTHPVAVDPDQRLEMHARQVGWPIISLR